MTAAGASTAGSSTATLGASSPDEENSPEELAAWRAACEAWDRGEHVHPAAEVHGPWMEPGTGRVTLGERPSPEAIGHCAAPRAYGMGATHCDQHKPAPDAWKSWPTRHGDQAATKVAS